ncbi:P-loop containing nucleoside triphosphate hydrolase protein [Pleomassaria siparia CBS 279.74]|uniref:P-loop containing nucleoside triphosphate hydrolase protein n=1 Tax=Pleomassaria siparia CBS 279.74 TaxID=1314801 RepID=A0A6G1JTV4_9PLEO|nr:P-loop containing nucleoside triphosphate hydrolase protein [Pleomassaria siparia CBS 279.74]
MLRLSKGTALVRDPELLLFDEATSALDTANEAIVQAAVKAATRPGLTTIAVAHRLSTIRRCDRIFVLHQGRVANEGNHDELMLARGRYHDIVLAQSLDYEVTTR